MRRALRPQMQLGSLEDGPALQEVQELLEADLADPKHVWCALHNPPSPFGFSQEKKEKEKGTKSLPPNTLAFARLFGRRSARCGWLWKFPKPFFPAALGREQGRSPQRGCILCVPRPGRTPAGCAGLHPTCISVPRRSWLTIDLCMRGRRH